VDRFGDALGADLIEAALDTNLPQGTSSSSASSSKK
jgi:hypothetical protein